MALGLKDTQLQKEVGGGEDSIGKDRAQAKAQGGVKKGYSGDFRREQFWAL
jgi:hypothetical protein